MMSFSNARDESLIAFYESVPTASSGVIASSASQQSNTLPQALRPGSQLSVLRFWSFDTRVNYRCQSIGVNFIRRRSDILAVRRKWGQLKSLRNFLRISLRSSAYSSTIRRASSVREGLLGGSDPEVGLSSCGFMKGVRGLLSIGSPPATRNAAVRG